MTKFKVMAVLSLFLLAPAFAIDIGEYKYFSRKKLGKGLKKILKKHEKANSSKPLKIKVVDEVVKLWKAQALEDGWVRFDTKHFRCIIQRSNSGEDSRTGYPKGFDLVRTISTYRKKTNTAKEIKRTVLNKKTAYKHYGLVTMYATVIRSSKWGKVSGGKSEGVKPEQIILRVEAAQVPRARYIKLYKKKY